MAGSHFPLDQSVSLVQLNSNHAGQVQLRWVPLGFQLSNLGIGIPGSFIDPDSRINASGSRIPESHFGTPIHQQNLLSIVIMWWRKIITIPGLK